MQRGRMRGTEVIDQAIDLRDALPCLTEKQAEALGMLYVQEVSQQRVGEQLNITQQAVSRRIDRALESIWRWMTRGL